jgi:Heterokaryon incompatibility protein Het-C
MSDFHRSPKNYNDDKDARQVDPRLRGPVRPIELQVDPDTGMKNYIANTRGDWATSAAYIKYSFERCIHHGRLYTNGHGFFKGKDEDLAEALRCLGQGLHCLEDFGAHTNYVELALREIGLNNVFPHTGTATAINLRGKHTFPLVTGTFGMVDFFHSVLGEATDHFTQSEIDEMDNALGSAQSSSQSSSPLKTFTSVLSKVPGTRDLCTEAEQLHASSQAQTGVAEQSGGARAAGQFNEPPGWHDPNVGYQQGYNQQPQWNQQPPPTHWAHQQQPPQWNQPPSHQNQWDQQQHQPQWTPQQPQWNQHQQHSQPPFNSQQVAPPTGPPQQGTPGPGLPGLPNFDPSKTIQQIYPILVFRDKVVRSISAIISKIPGLEALMDKITETLTVFILSLLAPFIRPIINGLTKQLQAGSSAVVDSSGRHQYEPWTDPNCTDPTHSMLSKDHFSNVLNEPAGQVASEILKFVAPRVLYAWDHLNVPVQQVLDDCMRVFHHPAARDHNIDVHKKMFDVVQHWANNRPGGAHELNDILSSEGVRAGRNHREKPGQAGHSHGGPPQHPIGGTSSGFSGYNQPSHQQGGSGGGFNPLSQVSHIPGMSGVSSTINKFSSLVPGGLGNFGGSGGGGSHGGRRDIDEDDAGPGYQSRGLQPEMANAEGSASPISRGPSPCPPAGYEGYSQQGSGGGDGYRPPAGYDGYGQQGVGHQGQDQNQYQGGQYYGGQGPSQASENLRFNDNYYR